MFNGSRVTPPGRVSATSRLPERATFRAGFTLVEVLIAVGIIAILVSIVAISLNTIMASSKTRATRAALENCAALQTEFENTGKLPDTVRAKFSAPAGGHAVATVAAMERLRQVPKVKEMIDRMPGGSLAPVDTSLVPVWSATTTYRTGDIVQQGAGILYRSTIDANTGNMPGGAGVTQWSAVPLPVTTLTDGWGNPIYCGGSSLNLSQTYSASAQYSVGMVVTDGAKSYKCIKAARGIAPSDPNYWAEVSSTISFARAGSNGRVFWVSSGPDGNILTDDDNVYSFEN